MKLRAVDPSTEMEVIAGRFLSESVSIGLLENRRFDNSGRSEIANVDKAFSETLSEISEVRPVVFRAAIRLFAIERDLRLVSPSTDNADSRLSPRVTCVNLGKVVKVIADSLFDSASSTESCGSAESVNVDN